MLTLKNPNGLARAVVALLAGNIFFDVLLGLFEARWLMADAMPYAFDPAVFGSVDLNVAYSMSFTLFVATVVVFIIWFHRLRNNAEVWAGDLQGRKPGWAIGGWFVPIGNLWIPRVIAVDIWRASRWEPYAADGKRELTLLDAWWSFWIADWVMDRVATQLYRRAETPEAYDTAAAWSLAGYVVDIVAAVLAILVVRRLTSMQTAKATGMIPAAQ
ncbi:DUF4328 domain-containing protein [Streptomyces sp. NRRL B-24572]|uniref:DUF4328 domain-containing protein n=1 Tax=Streptomyces sp. NRRL B-24572 TaxID=1962156 RepID=UPI000A3A1CA9|nr:DUF4328 domain-containing protein [Streptomyces sp. NRRL B-24572]